MEIINAVISYFTEAYILNPFAQIIGFVAFLVSIYNFSFCKNKKFIIFTAIASVFWGMHYLAFGLIAAGLVNVIDVFKNLLALKYERNKPWIIFFISVYIFLGALSFFISNYNIISLIPSLTGILGTLLVFYIRGIWLNIGFLGIIFLWMIYNYTGQSIGGLATDGFLMISGIMGVTRQLISEKMKNNG